MPSELMSQENHNGPTLLYPDGISMEQLNASQKVILLLDAFYTKTLQIGNPEQSFLERQIARLAQCDESPIPIDEDNKASKLIATFREKFPCILQEDTAIMRGFLDFSVNVEIYRIHNYENGTDGRGKRGYTLKYSPIFPTVEQYDGDYKPADHFSIKIPKREVFRPIILDVGGQPIQPHDSWVVGSHFSFDPDGTLRIISQETIDERIKEIMSLLANQVS